MKYIFRLRLCLKSDTWQILVNITCLLSVTGLALVVGQILQNVIDQRLKGGETTFLNRSDLRLVGVGAGTATLNLGLRYLDSLFPQWIAIVPAIRRWNPMLWKPAKAICTASSSADKKDSLEPGR